MITVLNKNEQPKVFIADFKKLSSEDLIKKWGGTVSGNRGAFYRLRNLHKLGKRKAVIKTHVTPGESTSKVTNLIGINSVVVRTPVRLTFAGSGLMWIDSLKN